MCASVPARAKMAVEPPSKKAKTEASKVAPGGQLPNVDLILQNGETVNLAEKYASGILVLYAYPKASTPGCTRQTSGFGKLYPEFVKNGAAVYGISADSPKAQTTFKGKTGVEFDLISDQKYSLLAPLGAKKTSSGGVIRSHWVFSDGKAVLIENNVKPDESPSKALEAVIKIKEESGKEGDAEASKDDDEESDKKADEKTDEPKEEPKEEPQEGCDVATKDEPEAKAAEKEAKPEDIPESEQKVEDEEEVIEEAKPETDDEEEEEKEDEYVEDEDDDSFGGESADEEDDESS